MCSRKTSFPCRVSPKLPEYTTAKAAVRRNAPTTRWDEVAPQNGQHHRGPPTILSVELFKSAPILHTIYVVRYLPAYHLPASSLTCRIPAAF